MRVYRDAQSEAARVIEDAKKTSSELYADIIAQAREEAEQIIAESQKEAEAKRDRIIAQAEAEARDLEMVAARHFDQAERLVLGKIAGRG